jgi:hypothetical protein
MNNPFDHIEEFLAGELSKTDTQQFEAALSNDAALRDEVEMVKEMELFAQRKADKKDALDVVKSVMEDGKRIEEGKEKGKSFIRAIAAAVLLCLAGLAAWVYFGQEEEVVNHEQLFTEYFQPEQPSFSVKSTAIDSSLMKAEFRFIIRDYRAALDNFNMIDRDLQNDPDVIYFKSISELALGNLDASEKGLQKLPIEYKNDVLWYRSLMNIRSGQITEAINSLQNIPDDSAYKSRSNELISKLSKQEEED